MRLRLQFPRETGLILRWDGKVGNTFQTKQGSRPSCPDQEGRMPLVLAQGSPIFHSSCEGELGIALESLQGK